jgi:hypothetical protein
MSFISSSKYSSCRVGELEHLDLNSSFAFSITSCGRLRFRQAKGSSSSVGGRDDSGGVSEPRVGACDDDDFASEVGNLVVGVTVSLEE